MQLRCREIFNNHFIANFTSERISKIGQYLLKLQRRTKLDVFWRHGVLHSSKLDGVKNRCLLEMPSHLYRRVT